MNPSKPKLTILLLCMIAIFSISACTGGSSSGDMANDTTFLASGVKYIYLKKGEGATVDSLTRVTTHINLIVGPDTIWSTYAEDQEEFQFDARRTSLIAGFNEVVMYTRTGDRILAIIPPELGYGERGSGVVPPNATLHFDIEILGVEPPKPFLSDILFDAFDGGNTEALLTAYEGIKGDSINYRIEMGEWYALNRRLVNDKHFEAAVFIWDTKLKETADMGGYYFKALAQDSLGQVRQAINTLEDGFKAVQDTSGTGFAKNYLTQLKNR